MKELESIESNAMWNFVWQTFANASLTYDLVSSQNGTKENIEENAWFDNPARLGILTGFLIACVADFRVTIPKFQLDVGLDSRLRTTVLTLINVLGFLTLAPIMSTTLLILYVYRKIVEFTLKMQFRDEFAGLLEGTDCVWALERSTALSVINVLAVLQKEDTTENNDFLMYFRKLIKDRLVSSNFDKLNWLREKKYGYYYWRRSNEVIPIEERVRWIHDVMDSQKCVETFEDIQEEILKTKFAEASNKPLLRNHSASWEILIGKTCIKSDSKSLGEVQEGFADSNGENTGNKTMIPILFRVHHCLGDGVALLRLLLESIADSDSIKVVNDSRNVATPKVEKMEADTKNDALIRVPLLRASSSILGSLKQEDEIVFYANNLLSASMPFSTGIPLRTVVKSILSYIHSSRKMLASLNIDDTKEEILNKLGNSWISFRSNYLIIIEKEIIKLGKTLATLIYIPSCLVQQALRSMDNSILHGPRLTGEKMVSCWIENEPMNHQHSNLLMKIRDIKNATGTRFGDVILAALSANLHAYFNKIGEAAPKNMTVVIPARMTIPPQKLSLQNGFSVGLLSLCVSEVNGESLEHNFPENPRLLERLGDISRCSNKLRNDPDYLINFWVMKWLSAALPECILRPALESHSTLVFSNLPGPQEVAILGYKLKNVVFWIPHRGRTGIGCSFLTYGGKVHISLVVDTALVRSQQLLDEILQGTVENIEKLHETISLSCRSMNLRDKSDAPTDTGLGVL